MATFRKNIKLGTVDPLWGTEDFAKASITTEKIADGAITNDKIADGALTTDKFKDGSLTPYLEDLEESAVKANEAAENADKATAEAENVDASISGTTLTVTNREGVSKSVDTKGETGETGKNAFQFVYTPNPIMLNTANDHTLLSQSFEFVFRCIDRDGWVSDVTLTSATLMITKTDGTMDIISPSVRHGKCTFSITGGYKFKSAVISAVFDCFGLSLGDDIPVYENRQGDPGGVIYPSFDINSNGHLIANIPTTEADLNVELNSNGHLILTI